MNIDLKLTLSTKPPQLYQFLHDWEIPGQIGTVRSCAGCPEVFNLGKLINNNYSHLVPLNRERQFFSFGLMSKALYKKEYSQLTRGEYDLLARAWEGVFSDTLAFSNGTGANSRGSYIRGDPPVDKDISYDKVRTCGGNTHHGLREVRNWLGRWMVEIETFNEPLPPVRDILLTDHRIFWATNVYRVGKVGMFGHLGSNGVPLPLFSSEPVYYPLSALRKLPLGSPVPSPYVV
jgi:hypothetical protein